MFSFPLPPSTLPLPKAPRIAIIGGGISGLSAAHRILELAPQAHVTLFEASGRLGGVLETVEREGFLIERSADNFLTTPGAALDLCRQLDMESDLVRTDESRRRAFVVRDGRLEPIPLGFYLMSPRRLWPVLRSPMLTIGGKLRLLAEPFIPRGNKPDESVAAFVRRRFGNEVLERLVQPLVAGIYTADPEKLSMAATMPQFFEIERNHGSLLRTTLRQSRRNAESVNTDSATGARYGLFVAPANGMQSLVTKLASRLPGDSIQVNSPITSISSSNESWTLSPNPQSSFDGLIIAIPAPKASQLLAGIDSSLAAELGAIEYAGCAVVSLGFQRSQIAQALDGFGFVVPQSEKRRIIAASFASLKYPGRAPDDDVLIRVFIGGALQPELLGISDSELVRIALDELTELLRITGEPQVSDVARWPHSMPQYHVGHLDRIARIEELAAAHPTLALAGNAYRGVGIPQCVASGRVAAERVISTLSTAK
jgi:oxygen-dependent protoporphyrinogen oxidase